MSYPLAYALITGVFVISAVSCSNGPDRQNIGPAGAGDPCPAPQAPDEARGQATKAIQASSAQATASAAAAVETQSSFAVDPSAIAALVAGGLVLFGVGIRATLEDSEAEERALSVGVPTALSRIEAESAGPNAFLLEFTVGEGDRRVACSGNLEVQLRVRSSGEVLAQLQVPVDLEGFRPDPCGHPCFRARFPFSPPPGARSEWLVAEFVFTPRGGRSLVGSVRFLHAFVG